MFYINQCVAFSAYSFSMLLNNENNRNVVLVFGWMLFKNNEINLKFTINMADKWKMNIDLNDKWNVQLLRFRNKFWIIFFILEPWIKIYASITFCLHNVIAFTL